MHLSLYDAQTVVRHRERDRRHVERMNAMLREARRHPDSESRIGLLERLFHGRAISRGPAESRAAPA